MRALYRLPVSAVFVAVLVAVGPDVMLTTGPVGGVLVLGHSVPVWLSFLIVGALVYSIMSDAVQSKMHGDAQ